jgi:hypothetical protein
MSARIAALALVAALLRPGPATAQTVEADRFEPAARGVRPSVARWRPLLEAYPWDVDTALRVVDCESGGDPAAVNPWSGAAGLWQLYGWRGLARRLFGSEDLLDPVLNTAVAFALWEDSGGRFSWHWYASRRCWAW